MNLKFTLLCLLALSVAESVSAQRKMETLDRGLVAVQVNKGVYLSWRIPGEEWYDVTYNVYRNGSKLNDAPLNVSNFTDANGTNSATYTVKAVVNGEEQEACAPVSVLNKQYLSVPMKDLYSKRGYNMNNAYSLNDVSTADLDGDGQYELIVKRSNGDFSLANDSAFCLFQAYKLDGTLLWTIDLGPNLINAGHVETNCMAFDFTEDGKAEVVLRTTDGTILPDGTIVGNATAKYRTGGDSYQTQGDEYLTVLDGVTGRLIDQVVFDQDPTNGNNLARRSASFWGDGYGHRANKFHFGAPYLDGRHPSIYLGRGCYTNFHASAYDLVNGKLKRLWTFTMDDTSSPFFGQGFHNFSVVDVDGDGCDELCQGNMVIDNDGKGLSATGLGHGDAQHYGDLDPFRKGIEGFRCLEDNPGAVLVDATTNEILFRWIRGNDCGRCMAGNFTDDFVGAELWTVDGHLWSATTSRAADQIVSSTAPGVTMNNRIFWDGDILEETFDYGYRNDVGDGFDGSVYKYGSTTPIFVANGSMTNNNTKGNPCLQADLFGDWREELVLRTPANNELRIYISTTPTEHRNYSLMYDAQYRQAIYWQMTGYNQPPHVSYFLGNREGILLPPPPACTNGKVEIDGSLTSEQNDQFVLMAKIVNTTVEASGTLTPSNIMVNTRADYRLNGGTFTGNMRMIKMGEGTLTLNGGTYNYAGNTEVWAGNLSVEGNASFTNSPVILKRFAAMNANCSFERGIKMEYGATLRPSLNGLEAGTTHIAKITTSTLDIDGGAILEFDLDGSLQTSDRISVQKLCLQPANCIGATPVFKFNYEGVLASGEYTLIDYQTLEGDLSTVVIEGLEGASYTLKAQDNKVILVVNALRAATVLTWQGAVSNIWDFAKTLNFSNQGNDDIFVTGDEVNFDASATTRNIDVAETVYPNRVCVSGDKDYTFDGAGTIAGTAQLIKEGTSTLTLNNINTFTGGVQINGGTVVVQKLADSQNAGNLGAYTTNAGMFSINNGSVLSTSSILTNDAPITLGGTEGGVITNSAEFTQNGVLTGTTFTKRGTSVMHLSAYNSHKKTILEEGTLQVMPEYQGQSSLGDTIILKGGTLQFNDNTGTFCSSYVPWVVPQGATATARLDSRCNYRASLLGAGNLTIYVPAYYRTYLYGNWSDFTGTLNVTGAQSSDYPIIFTNTYGMPNATMNIPNAKDYVQLGDGNVSTNGTYTVGALTGTGTLASGSSTSNTWAAGASNQNFTFKGIINAKFQKVGTGIMTMTANTGSGAITVSEGTLYCNNTGATTSATGANTLTLENGTLLYGRGYMGNSRVTVKSGATFRPGYLYLGNLSVKGSVSVESGGVLEFRINSSTTNSKLTIGQACLFAGTIRILANSSYVPKVGDTFSFWNATIFNANYKPTFDLPELPEGMEWDTSELASKTGTLRVVVSSGIEGVEMHDQYQVQVYTTSGLYVTTFTSDATSINEQMSTLDIEPGTYVLKMTDHEGKVNPLTKKYIKN